MHNNNKKNMKVDDTSAVAWEAYNTGFESLTGVTGSWTSQADL
jgi:hypothetical protein